jgi:hypothetical protein
VGEKSKRWLFFSMGRQLVTNAFSYSLVDDFVSNPNESETGKD